MGRQDADRSAKPTGAACARLCRCSCSVTQLDIQLQAAHARKDAAALAELYAAGSAAAQTLDEQCFLTTQAYIFALESNHPLAEKLHAFLVQNRRDA